MELSELRASLQDALTVRRVFGDPYERDGVTVIPVATVLGGAGGGKGEKGSEEGEGGGIGLVVKPAGAYVIQGGQVKWQPAVDVNRIVAGGQLVALAALLVLRRFLVAVAEIPYGTDAAAPPIPRLSPTTEASADVLSPASLRSARSWAASRWRALFGSLPGSARRYLTLAAKSASGVAALHALSCQWRTLPTAPSATRSGAINRPSVS